MYYLNLSNYPKKLSYYFLTLNPCLNMIVNIILYYFYVYA